jgi:hypothetical protein
MATTTNYGWTTPDDTALVKDGAAAIRTLGSSVDTTTKALNPSTTLGDIEYRSSTANTNTRLGIGSTGNVLTVTGGVPVWAAPVTGGMTLISTTTLANATTTLSSIPQTYKSLYIVITGMTANTSNQRLRMLPNNVNNLSDYSLLENATAITYKSDVVRLTDADTTRTNANNAWAITIDNYTSSTAFKPFEYYGRWIDSGAAARTIFAGGVFCSTTAITSIVFDYQGVNTFSAGTILFYGVS